MGKIIKAAGAIVFYSSANSDTLQIVVIHRPRYDDFSFPKGKIDPWESEQQAALREVKEETGLDCKIIKFLDTVRYLDRSGTPKEVSYFVMKEAQAHNPNPQPGFEAFGEVDKVFWMSPADAEKTLSYERDRELLNVFMKDFSLWIDL